MVVDEFFDGVREDLDIPCNVLCSAISIPQTYSVLSCSCACSDVADSTKPNVKARGFRFVRCLVLNQQSKRMWDGSRNYLVDGFPFCVELSKIMQFYSNVRSDVWMQL